jgi:hypothetical protein
MLGAQTFEPVIGDEGVEAQGITAWWDKKIIEESERCYSPQGY